MISRTLYQINISVFGTGKNLPHGNLHGIKPNTLRITRTGNFPFNSLMILDSLVKTNKINLYITESSLCSFCCIESVVFSEDVAILLLNHQVCYPEITWDLKTEFLKLE